MLKRRKQITDKIYCVDCLWRPQQIGNEEIETEAEDDDDAN